jgi:regulator of nucleoside diphosphate kinase
MTALLQKARPSAAQNPNGDAPAFGIEWAALWIMRVAGLVSFNKRHVLLTDAGREVYRRIYNPPLQRGADEIPEDIITVNSRAELLDLETGERMEFTLVLPMDANIEAGKISVLAPLGAAMLGYRAGDEFEWVVPYGLRRLKVMAVRFQPEAALAMAA